MTTYKEEEWLVALLTRSFHHWTRRPVGRGKKREKCPFGASLVQAKSVEFFLTKICSSEICRSCCEVRMDTISLRDGFGCHVPCGNSIIL